MSIDRLHPGSPHDLLAAAAAALARPGAGDPVAAVLDLAARAVGADEAAVYARDPERDELFLAAAVGRVPAAPADAGMPSVPAASETVAAALGRVTTLERDGSVDGTVGTASDLPLVVTRDGIELGLGAVTFAWRGRRPTADVDRLLLTGFADLIAVALDRWRLASLADSRAERTDRLAMMDRLTGLANARTLDRVLDLEVARAGRQGGDVSVAVFDIDGFAALNERAGRAAGDDALRQVAAALAGSVRLVDTVARTGADEFVVVAPGSAGRTVARRVLQAVAALPAQPAGSEPAGRVTVSAGIAYFPADGAMASELLGSARRALDLARSGGGGRIAGGDGIEPA